MLTTGIKGSFHYNGTGNRFWVFVTLVGVSNADLFLKIHKLRVNLLLMETERLSEYQGESGAYGEGTHLAFLVVDYHQRFPCANTRPFFLESCESDL